MEPPRTAAGLIDSAAGGRYEDVLGVGYDATREQINRAHVRALFRFRGNTVAEEALNRAKGLLAEERTLDKARRLLRIERREEALEHLGRLLEDSRRPPSREDRAEAHHLAGWTLFRLERCAEALPHLERAAALRGLAADEVWLGNALEHLGLIERALDCYRRAVESRGHPAERRLLCKALLALDRWEEALSCCGSQCGRHPELDEIRRHLDRRRRRSRMRGALGRAVAALRREPLDWLLAGLTLAYGAYYVTSLIH